MKERIFIYDANDLHLSDGVQTWKHNRQEQFLKDFDFYYPYFFLSPAQEEDSKNTLKIHVKKSRNWDFLEQQKKGEEKIMNNK